MQVANLNWFSSANAEYPLMPGAAYVYLTQAASYEILAFAEWINQKWHVAHAYNPPLAGTRRPLPLSAFREKRFVKWLSSRHVPSSHDLRKNPLYQINVLNAP